MGGTRPLALTTNNIPSQRRPIYMLSLVGGGRSTRCEIHRIMLNASVAYGLGLEALDIEPDSKKCNPLVRDLLTSFAKIEFIPEAMMDVACSVGGNG